MINTFTDLRNILVKSSELDIVCHVCPDADALGSMFAFGYLVSQLGVDKVNLVCLDSIPKNLKSHFKGVKTSLSSRSEIVVVMDCSELSRAGLNLSNVGKRSLVNIDHHKSNEMFGDINLVEEVSSTCEIVYDMYKETNLDFVLPVAEWLMLGVLFDTGGLSHSNTSAKVLRIVGELASVGAKVELINKILFGQCNTNDLKLLGVIFRRAKINHNAVLSCVVSKNELLESGCDISDLKVGIDYLNQVIDKKIALLGFEEENGDIKFSIRSSGDQVDVSKIAQLFKGGGHRKAAGFKI